MKFLPVPTRTGRCTVDFPLTQNVLYSLYTSSINYAKAKYPTCRCAVGYFLIYKSIILNTSSTVSCISSYSIAPNPKINTGYRYIFCRSYFFIPGCDTRCCQGRWGAGPVVMARPCRLRARRGGVGRDGIGGPVVEGGPGGAGAVPAPPFPLRPDGASRMEGYSGGGLEGV